MPKRVSRRPFLERNRAAEASFIRETGIPSDIKQRNIYT